MASYFLSSNVSAVSVTERRSPSNPYINNSGISVDDLLLAFLSIPEMICFFTLVHN